MKIEAKSRTENSPFSSSLKGEFSGARVIYKAPDFLAINKPAGLLVHKVESSKLKVSKKIEETLVDWLVKKYPEVKKVGDDVELRPGIVHRLDKDTSGVILICRNQNFFEYAKKLFQEHKVKKNYLALVYGEVKPKTGVIEKAISIKSGTTKRTIWQGKDGKEAITEYKVLKFLKLKIDEKKEQIFSLLSVMPKTGRTHQIRVHLSSIGHSIVGDTLYGFKNNPFGLKRQFLHAESLEFNLMDGGRIKIEADLPDDLQEILNKLTD